MSVPDLSGLTIAPGPTHDSFLALEPVVRRYARVAFRYLDNDRREETVAEAVAAAFESYVHLITRERDPADFPSQLTKYAVLHVMNDRHVGGHINSCDVLAFKVQRKHCFRVESLHDIAPRCANTRSSVRPPRVLEAFEEHLQDNSQTPIPDQVCFRLDWAAF